MPPVLDPPRLSVIVASFSGPAALARCLESLATEDADAEVIVSIAEAAPDIVARFPRARFVSAPPGASVFRLRSLGIAHCRGRVIALTEDHCTAGPGWPRLLREAVEAGRPVVGGAVENGRAQTAHDRALFLCEYGAHLPSLPEGAAMSLTGVNVAYERERLLGCRAVWAEGFYENEVHDALQQAGCNLFRVPAVVRSHLAFGFAEAAAHLFRGGRRFGAYRGGGKALPLRALLLLASPAVPLVLLMRLLRGLLERRRDELPGTLPALPHLFAFCLAWGAGESSGYLEAMLSPRASGCPGA